MLSNQLTAQSLPNILLPDKKSLPLIKRIRSKVHSFFHHKKKVPHSDHRDIYCKDSQTNLLPNNKLQVDRVSSGYFILENNSTDTNIDEEESAYEDVEVKDSKNLLFNYFKSMCTNPQNYGQILHIIAIYLPNKPYQDINKNPSKILTDYFMKNPSKLIELSNNYSMMNGVLQIYLTTMWNLENTPVLNEYIDHCIQLKQSKSGCGYDLNKYSQANLKEYFRDLTKFFGDLTKFFEKNPELLDELLNLTLSDLPNIDPLTPTAEIYEIPLPNYTMPIKLPILNAYPLNTIIGNTITI